MVRAPPSESRWLPSSMRHDEVASSRVAATKSPSRADEAKMSEPLVRVRLSHLAPPYLRAIDRRNGAVRRGYIHHFSRKNGWPIVQWDDAGSPDQNPIYPEYLELIDGEDRP